MTEPLKNQHVRNIPLDIILTLITCFLYNIYVQYKQYKQCAAVLLKKDASSAGLIAVVLTAFGLSIVNDAIQQSEINGYYGSPSL